uniref:Scavenger receptor class B member 1 n=1 Tax=Timema californicum TaxID=61474 RepID=A0A7R9J3C8_TIMCA|nr:unnamed protein product [Timema californicum]
MGLNSLSGVGFLFGVLADFSRNSKRISSESRRQVWLDAVKPSVHTSPKLKTTPTALHRVDSNISLTSTSTMSSLATNEIQDSQFCTSYNNFRETTLLEEFDAASVDSATSALSTGALQEGSEWEDLRGSGGNAHTKLRLFNNRNFMPEGFEKEVDTAGGVKGYRFSPPTNVFGEVSKNPENDCFCPAGPPCAPNGLFNVSLCQYDSPVLISFPHFYLADPKLRDAVEGISPPEKEKHQLYIDVQPQMGIALRARARVQINLAVSQVVDIKQVATFPDIIFPIMWFEDGIDGLPSQVTDLLDLATNAPPIARAALSYGLFALGGILLILALLPGKGLTLVSYEKLATATGCNCVLQQPAVLYQTRPCSVIHNVNNNIIEETYRIHLLTRLAWNNGSSPRDEHSLSRPNRTLREPEAWQSERLLSWPGMRNGESPC